MGLNLLSIYHIAYTNKKLEFWLDRWVIKDINDRFKVVASRYCDESEHMDKLVKSSSPLASNKFIAILANAVNDSELW